MTSFNVSSGMRSCSGVKPAWCRLAWNQVSAGDLQFFLLAVAGQAEDFHAVQQRLGNRVQRVGRGDEKDLREVERQVEIVVTESAVLGRVEDFHERSGRVAAVIAAQLVDLVEHQDRIVDAGATDRLDDPARHGADIGATMAAQLGLVVQAAQAGALELAADRAGNRLAQRGLADSRRPDQTQDRRRVRGFSFSTARYSRMRSLISCKS